MMVKMEDEDEDEEEVEEEEDRKKAAKEKMRMNEKAEAAVMAAPSIAAPFATGEELMRDEGERRRGGIHSPSVSVFSRVSHELFPDQVRPYLPPSPPPSLPRSPPQASTTLALWPSSLRRVVVLSPRLSPCSNTCSCMALSR